MLVRAISLSILFSGLVSAQDHDKPGYTDTPKLPDSEWRVHDAARPRPTVVDPGPAKVLGEARAPSDATVLFDGRLDAKAALAAFQGGDGKAARWKVENGAMIVNRTGDIQTKESFGDCQLHVEWMVPTSEAGASQGGGNSGVFFFGRYEIQVLNSHQNPTYADGQAAALYGQYPPMVNACRPLGEWQAYDIFFRAPRFDEAGKLVSPAIVTVHHNGILVHDHRAMIGATRHREVAGYQAHAAEGPIRLQDHGNPVHFRNMWIRRL